MRLPSASLLFPACLNSLCALNRRLNPQRVSFFQGSGQQKRPGSRVESMWEHRNVFINRRETRGLGRSD